MNCYRMLLFASLATTTPGIQSHAQTRTSAGASSETEIITGLATEWIMDGPQMRITYYPIHDLRSYVNAAVASRPLPDLKKQHKAELLIVDFPSVQSADSVQSLFEDQYLILSTDPAHRKIILTKAVPHNVLLQRVGVTEFRSK